jgi:ribosomal protein S18 acetylase RimI-like enzyme
MRIRHYHPADDPALMQLERLSPRGLPEPFVHFRRRFIDRAALFTDHQLLVADLAGEVVGCVAIAVKRTHIGGRPVSVGYVFDLRAHPDMRRHGIGTRLLHGVEDYLKDRKVDGVYGHVVTSNVPSLKLFEKMGYKRLRQLIMLIYQPFPLFEFPDWMPLNRDNAGADEDLIQAVYSSRDLYVPDVAERVKHFGFQRWSLDQGDARFAGMSLFDQSYVFQQWPADEPYPDDDELDGLSSKSLRLFDEIGTHNRDLLRAIFDTLRDLAVTDGVSKLSMLLDRMAIVPQFVFAEAVTQLDYWMMFKTLNPDWIPEWQDGPIYVDTREL